MASYAPTENDQRIADVKLTNSLASAYYFFGQYESARRLIDFSLWLDPENAQSLKLKLITLLAQQRPQDAAGVMAALEKQGEAVSDRMRDLVQAD